MGQLRVTPEQLHARASEYRAQGAEVESVIAKLDSLIGVLESEWEGNSASRYISQYSDLRPSFVSMQQLIIDLASSLDNEANKFAAADG